MSRAIGYDEKKAIGELLIGRKVKKVNDDTIMLDNGTVLQIFGNRGGCLCGSGDYDITELNEVDNIITSVEFDYNPGGDHRDDLGEGYYKIFVYADNRKVNLVTLKGSDGNGHYGTGYEIIVVAPEKKADETFVPNWSELEPRWPFVLIGVKPGFGDSDDGITIKIDAGCGISNMEDTLSVLLVAASQLSGYQVPDRIARKMYESLEKKAVTDGN